jgi:hypothetical protein
MTAIALRSTVAGPGSGPWLRIGYLASADDRMVVRVGEADSVAAVSRGLHSVYVRVDGPLRPVALGGLHRGTTVCVDTVEVGTPVPGQLL